MSGSLSYQGSQITLTLPAPVGAASIVPLASQPASSEFSKDFLNATIETLSDIREWQSTLLNAVQNGYPVTEAGWMITVRKPPRAFI